MSAIKVTAKSHRHRRPFPRRRGCLATLTAAGLSLASLPLCGVLFQRECKTYGPTMQARAVVIESQLQASEAYFPPCEMKMKVLEGPYRGQILEVGIQPNERSCQKYVGKETLLSFERTSDQQDPLRMVDIDTDALIKQIPVD